MKNTFLVPLTLTVFVACSSKHNGDNQIDYKMDTLMVDSKGEIIMGATNLFLSGFDSKLSTLYHYSNQTAEVEVIDLDNLSIKHRIKIEKEGPEGVGSNVNKFYFLEESIFVFDNYFGLSHLDISGKKTAGYKFRDFGFFKELEEESDRFTNNFCFLDSPTRFLAPVYSRKSDFKYLALVDLENDQMDKLEIEELKVINNYNVTLKMGNSMRSIIQVVDMLKVDELIYISNAANNDIYTYNIQTKERRKIDVKTDKLSAGKSGTYKNETEDNDEFAEIFRRMYFEIEYKQLVRDPSNGNFYRFSMQKIREKTDELLAKFDVHLVAYDKDFQLLSETKIPEMNSVAQIYFWKDNAIWMHENVEDELGFVRLKFLP
jgi:hypothetical protein